MRGVEEGQVIKYGELWTGVAIFALLFVSHQLGLAFPIVVAYALYHDKQMGYR